MGSRVHGFTPVRVMDYDGSSMASSSQRAAVVLAFVAGALSLLAAAIDYSATGQVRLTPLAGGLFMIALGVTGLMRIRKQP